MYHILIAGAGYTGSAIGRFYAQKMQQVYAMTRSAQRAAGLKERGMIPFVADVTQPATLEALPPAHFIVIAMAPAERTEEAYRAVYVDGLRNFLESRKKKPAPFLMLYLSSVGVYGENKGGWVDEAADPAADSRRAGLLLEAESLVLSSGFPSIVLRLGGIYGPRRNRIEKLAREGASPDEEPDRFLNLIHVADIVTAVDTLFKQGKPGEIYLGCDDFPVRKSEMEHWILRRLGRKEEFRNRASEPAGGKRCRNRKLRELGWSPVFPDFKTGYSALLDDFISCSPQDSQGGAV